MVDQARRDRDTNLAYNSFNQQQFTAIMRAAPLKVIGAARSREGSLGERLGNNFSALTNTGLSSSDTFARATKTIQNPASQSYSGPWMAKTKLEYKQNLDASKKGTFLITTNMPNHETNRDVYQGIGWGVNNSKLRHDLVNVQKERFAKPTLRHLDNAKRSNFINYLQTKHNEINHVKQDYAHPKMFYLTGNKPEIRNF